MNKPSSRNEKLLAQIVGQALQSINLDDYAALIRPATANFAELPSADARSLLQHFVAVPTSSHKKAWQHTLRQGSYAVKLYETNDKFWHITIVSTGLMHKFDELVYHYAPKFWSNALNLRNALYWRART